MPELGWLRDLGDGRGGWISLLLAFAILPAFYVKYAFDVQKEYADFSKTIFNSQTLSGFHKSRTAEQIEDAIQVFQLEWGVVCAIAILVLANFSTIYLVELSSFAKASCSGSPSAAVPVGQLTVACGQVKTLLSLYSIATVLLIFFQLSWARIAAMRRMRKIYLELAMVERRKAPAGL